jgi:hypothetical protein
MIVKYKMSQTIKIQNLKEELKREIELLKNKMEEHELDKEDTVYSYLKGRLEGTQYIIEELLK